MTFDEPSHAPCPEPTGARPTFLVDGFNVLHAVLLGGQERVDWWRSKHRDKLIDKVRQLPGEGVEVWIAFDGPHPLREPSTETAAPPPAVSQDGPATAHGPRIRSVFAPSADEWVARVVRRCERPDALVVVTGDRRLAGRVRHHGARVESPRQFLRRCQPEAGGEPEAASGSAELDGRG